MTIIEERVMQMNLKKAIQKVVTILGITTIILAPSFAQSATQPVLSESVTVKINGRIADMKDAPAYINANSRTMVSARFVSEALGYDVQWLPDTKRVIVKKGSDTIILTIDSPQAFLNFDLKTMDTYATLKNNRTMVPLRFVSEALGAQVSWDGTNRVVNITADTTPIDTTAPTSYATDARPAVSQDPVTEIANIKQIIPTAQILGDNKSARFRLDGIYTRGQDDMLIDCGSYPKNFGISLGMEATQNMDIEKLVKILIDRHCGGSASQAFSIYQSYAKMSTKPGAKTVINLPGGGKCYIDKWTNYSISINIAK